MSYQFLRNLLKASEDFVYDVLSFAETCM